MPALSSRQDYRSLYLPNADATVAEAFAQARKEGMATLLRGACFCQVTEEASLGLLNYEDVKPLTYRQVTALYLLGEWADIQRQDDEGLARILAQPGDVVADLDRLSRSTAARKRSLSRITGVKCQPCRVHPSYE